MNDTKLEPVVRLLFIGICVCIFALFVDAKFFPNDGQMFQVVAGLMTAFSGAFFMRVNPKDSRPQIPEGSSGTISNSTVVKVPAAPEPPTLNGAPIAVPPKP